MLSLFGTSLDRFGLGEVGGVMGLTFEMLGVILHRNRNPNISSTCLFTP